jgi:hypothetical protein
MPSQLTFPISVVMEKIAIDNRWQPFKWQPAGILPDNDRGETMLTLRNETNHLQQLWPGFMLTVFPDEAEGYYLNISSPEPHVFVMWRLNDETSDAFPHSVTLSYNEAARWMDAQEKVDGVAMPAEIFAALQDWVSENYKPPEKKQRIRPKSFESKDGRYKSGMSS